MDGILNSSHYKRILQSRLVPFAKKQKGEWHFQQDNASVHTERALLSWLTNHPHLKMPIKWPAYSADLSPIENLWGIMQLKINEKNPQTMAGLKAAIKKVWKNCISDTTLMHSLLASWRSRVTTVVELNGDRIDY